MMSGREVAQLCGVSPATVQKWARCGKLPAVRLSSRGIRYEMAAVEALLAKSRGVKGGPRA
jgi:excisionase family DNA binding protein